MEEHSNNFWEETPDNNFSRAFELPNIFIWGFSGSGKDTIANYIRDNYGYMKCRLAKTIKQVICETNDITFNKLDVEKRVKPELRSAHWEIGKLLDTIAQKQTGNDHSLNRLNQLLSKTSIEFEVVSGLTNYPLIICDGRIDNECRAFFEYHKQHQHEDGIMWPLVIFLAKIPEEFIGDGKHKTEQNLFQNGNLEQYIAEYSDCASIHLIMNNNYSPKDEQYLKEYWGRLTDKIYFPGTDMKQILQIIDSILTPKAF